MNWQKIFLAFGKLNTFRVNLKFRIEVKQNNNSFNFIFLKKEERYQSNNNYDNWEAAQKHIEKFCPPNITFDEINIDFVKNFQKFLHTTAIAKSGYPLSQNTKHTYYNKFKSCLSAAFEEGYLKENIVRKVKSIPMGETHREYLTLDEVKKLYKTDCRIPVLKTAFLYSILTGTRWSDINKLIWSEIRDEGKDNQVNEIYRMVFAQKKTNGVEYLYISKQARDLIGERKGKDERVFVNLHYSAHMNFILLRWCMYAGITKHITFHSARHTNAALMLENGADIYTVSKRLGHKEIRTTEIYAKIIDKKMKEAANLIPELKIEI